jgi:hypothetical protein
MIRVASRRARRWRNRLARLSRATLRVVDWHTVAVSRLGGIGWRERQLDSAAPPYLILPTTLVVIVPDASWLTRLAISGLLTGKVQTLRVQVAITPEWLTVGLRPLRVDRTTDKIVWQRRGGSLEVGFRWTKPYPVHRALAAAVAALVRARAWDQASGPVYALDRTAWLDGTSSWPQGHLTDGRASVRDDSLGRPLGAYQIPAQPADDSQTASRPVITAVANPYGRRLVGAATRYRLVSDPTRSVLLDDDGLVTLRLDPRRSAEAAILGSAIDKYAAVTVDSPVRPGSFVADSLRALAGCGVVFAAPDRLVRSGLEAIGVVVVPDPAEVAGLRGYALSVQAARRIAVTGDAALRRTALNGEGALPLPTVSVVLSSMRAEHIEACLGYLAAQTYPAMEVVVGLHGYGVSEQTRERWHALLPCRLRVLSFSTELTFGMVLGQLSRAADGELITKVDDDDHYGRNHVTDLVIALHTSGADLTAKGSRFVHFPELGETIDRAWAAREVFNVTPAGGTLLLSRGVLQQIGGWSHSSRHVDTDLLIRVKSSGGLVYRTHGLEYVYVRRTAGHTWATEIDQIAAQRDQVYHGLPSELLRPAYSAAMPPTPASGAPGHPPGGAM